MSRRGHRGVTGRDRRESQCLGVLWCCARTAAPIAGVLNPFDQQIHGESELLRNVFPFGKFRAESSVKFAPKRVRLEVNVPCIELRKLIRLLVGYLSRLLQLIELPLVRQQPRCRQC
jgi:hypothetical protein